VGITADNSVLYNGNLLSRSEAFSPKKKSVCGGNHEVMDRLIYFMVGTLSQPVCAYNSPPPPIHRYTFQDPRGGA